MWKILNDLILFLHDFSIVFKTNNPSGVSLWEMNLYILRTLQCVIFLFVWFSEGCLPWRSELPPPVWLSVTESCHHPHALPPPEEHRDHWWSQQSPNCLPFYWQAWAPLTETTSELTFPISWQQQQQQRTAGTSNNLWLRIHQPSSFLQLLSHLRGTFLLGRPSQCLHAGLSPPLPAPLWDRIENMIIRQRLKYVLFIYYSSGNVNYLHYPCCQFVIGKKQLQHFWTYITWKS